MGEVKLIDIYEDEGPTASHLRFLYILLSERKVSESISHKRHPTMQEHVRFVVSQPYLSWYIITLDGELAGTCYITKYREVGIWLLSDMKGKGVGRLAIGDLLFRHPGRVYTNTSIFNEGAFEFYQRCGFRHCANMLEHDNDGRDIQRPEERVHGRSEKHEEPHHPRTGESYPGSEKAADEQGEVLGSLETLWGSRVVAYAGVRARRP